MSLLNLIYLEENEADRVIGVVRQWCELKGVAFDSAVSREGLDIAVRLTKTSRFSDDLLAALLQQTTHLASVDISRQILIVEDEPLIAIDLEECLGAAGFATELQISRAAAMPWLAYHTPAAALLDVRLKDESSEEIAVLLTARNVPFIVCSGSHPLDVAGIFAQATWLPKPCDHEKLVAKLEELMLRNDLVKPVEQRA